MTEADVERDKRVEKINALLNKAQDKGATPEESEAFFAKAQALMTKWAIDDIALKAAGKMVNDVIKTIRLPIPSTYFVQMIHLWNAVGGANDVVVLMQKNRYSKQGAGQVVLTGFTSDLDRVQLLTLQLTTFALREAQRESKKVGGDYYFRRSFIDGFASRIATRLQEGRKEAVADEKAATGNDLLPALVSKQEEVDNFVARTMRIGKAKTSQQKYNYAGAAAGIAAANRADIGNTRIGGNRGALPH